MNSKFIKITEAFISRGICPIILIILEDFHITKSKKYSIYTLFHQEIIGITMHFTDEDELLVAIQCPYCGLNYPAHEKSCEHLIWKDIEEESNQWFVNLKFPFEQWSQETGYMKLGMFADRVVRHYNQDSFSNQYDTVTYYQAPWQDYWSEVWPDEYHKIMPSEIDVDYEGLQNITAWYYMMDLPLISSFNVIGGVRIEDTELSIINYPEPEVTWYPTGTTPVKLNPGDADVSIKQTDTDSQ